MTGLKRQRERRGDEPDWDFFLPDDDETFPEPGDFWVDREDDDCP